MMEKLYIPVLAGTAREQRRSIYAARLVYEVGKSIADIETELIDPQAFNFPGDGNDPEGKDPRYTAITVRADGFFIVTPEYNHSFPGSLKRMLDSELKNYIHKPVAFAGVSKQAWGGVRAIEALVNTVREMGLVATFSDVQFPRVQELFDEQGKLTDPAYTDYIKAAYTELIWMAKALRWARASLPSQYHTGQENLAQADTSLSLPPTTQLAQRLKAAEAAHAKYEAKLGHRDDDWPKWYAEYITNHWRDDTSQPSTDKP